MIQQTKFLGISLRTRSHRRALVLTYYAWLLTLMTIACVRGKFLPGGIIAQTFVLGAMFGGIKTGGPVKSYTETPGPEESSPITTLNLNGRSLFSKGYLLDERERGTRDQAHYVAYRLLMFTLAIALALLMLTLPWTLSFFDRNAATLLWTLMVYVLSLPQSVILWTEPEPLAEGGLTLVGS